MRMFTKSIVVVFSIAALVGGMPGAVLAANLVQNGQFTDITTGSKGPGQIIDPSSPYSYTTVADWSRPTGNNFALLFDPTLLRTWVAYRNQYDYLPSSVATNQPAGNILTLDVDRQSDYAWSMSQTLTGLNGGDVTVSFWYGGVGNFGSPTATQERLQVSLGSESHYTEFQYNSHDSFSGWQLATMVFHVTSASEVLTFLGEGYPVGAPPYMLIADIAATQPSSVPEPSTMLTSALGALGVIGARYYRRRTKAAYA